MKNRRFLSIFLSLALLLGLSGLSTAAAVEDFAPKAKAAYLYNDTTGDTLYSYQEEERMFPSSLTKVMTALLVLETMEEGKLTEDQLITASKSAWAQLSGKNASTQNLRFGEEMSVKDLLYCLMLPSADDAANILAEAVSGSVNDFVTLMNRRAKELGCTGTCFTNPHGLHDEGHYSTARDLCLMTREAMKYPLFRTIVGTEEYHTTATNNTKSRHFYNTNALLSNYVYYGYVYKQAIGVKYAHTDEAGHCLIAAAVKDGTTLISVLLGAENEYNAAGRVSNRLVFSESRRLLEYGFDSFSVQTILSTEELMGQVSVTLAADSDAVLLRPAENFSAMLPNDVDLSLIQREMTLYEDPIQAPVAAGQQLGELALIYEGKTLGVVPILAVSEVAASQSKVFMHNLKLFFQKTAVKVVLLVLLLAAVVFLLWRLGNSHRRRRYGSSNHYNRSSYRGRRRHRF